uniref:DUF5615 domain-containing protein n=1 Tax=Candidatus Kentrum sp. MB TaxID=2138164 RepID=A0A450XWS9_9GAMM|nr:MAG: hypothetical protein BECKMB1821G_GA0114241_11792 [Candidatus Kentron sp. MB]VFK35344.1 MAG: hypothetical protein BECKMB1821I_GA0114274_11132 [Candidatus Kentron sp. MB]VFK77234.1 MAG: hypothetical protein BECKMB1821H_GA0114242_11132 [Candidatus Kentron sp. MB]
MPFGLYGNENFPQPSVEYLRKEGHDILTVLDSGHAGQAWPDDEVLRFAVSQQRAVITMNRRHFIALHNRFPNHQGIIVRTYDPDFAALALRIHQALGSVDFLTGRLIRINRPSA